MQAKRLSFARILSLTENNLLKILPFLAATGRYENHFNIILLSMYSQILNNIKQHVTLSQLEEQEFVKLLTVRKVNKKEILCKEGIVCDTIYFVSKGCLRLFHKNADDEKTLDFLPENRWHTDFESYLLNLPSDENIDALEDSEVVLFKKKEFDKLLLKYPVFERLGRLLAESALIRMVLLAKEMRNLNPEERYLKILKTQPHLIEKIPQYFLASYLGIQSESLSRIKKRILL